MSKPLLFAHIWSSLLLVVHSVLASDWGARRGGRLENEVGKDWPWMKIWKWEKKDEVSTSRHQLPNECSIRDVVSAALPTADIFKDLGPHFLDMIHAEKKTHHYWTIQFCWTPNFSYQVSKTDIFLLVLDRFRLHNVCGWWKPKMAFPHLMPMFSASNFEEPLGARVGGVSACGWCHH